MKIRTAAVCISLLVTASSSAPVPQEKQHIQFGTHIIQPEAYTAVTHELSTKFPYWEQIITQEQITYWGEKFAKKYDTNSDYLLTLDEAMRGIYDLNNKPFPPISQILQHLNKK